VIIINKPGQRKRLLPLAREKDYYHWPEDNNNNHWPENKDN
jgi:hypothetical protein